MTCNLYSTVMGSAMGARHSGKLANPAFAVLVEDRFIHRLRDLHIYLYLLRFDDILVVADNFHVACVFV